MIVAKNVSIFFALCYGFLFSIRIDDRIITDVLLLYQYCEGFLARLHIICLKRC